MNAAAELRGSLEMFRRKGISAGLFTPEWAEGGEPENAFYLNQIHSGEVHLLSAGDDLNSRPKADAVITRESRCSLCVRTADCLPILLADHTSGWIAAIHGGWRGLQQHIIGNTFGMLAGFGVSGSDVSVYIGPSVRNCCYCVSEEMKTAFDGRYFSERSDG
ncbi:MAG: polyphenol oxidase family protein, partial [Candidatus Omnitrophica bacterium]|nr:polyphenol oxidase family protein [Candidatus Omnitrophota bacterium]